ncbi:hypothetical protein HMPREF1624_06197 [Sporothrix schenckii ATCC 58251]|uniref:EF-hand domain-containing protein n=2 Tax=Sporothrix schenckii TaxID=29908 RepID=U7PTF5_SPOS1|nr:hypothetical protein HMPREF1624_06197 [Sporothrix schenckii ATCC 58251]
MSCGEGWNQIMEDFAGVEPPLCVEAPTFFGSDCGSTAWARVLFIAWNIISMYIFVNLFVSLIYESFSYVYQRSSGLADISRDEIRRFKEAWRSVDPNGTGFISREAFPRLLGELSGVFEMRIYDHEDSVRSILEFARNDDTTPQARHASLASQTALTGVNLQKLNDRINQIDLNRVRERRRRFNIFYEEVMVSADPDKGIFFTTVLMILAHYNIISDSKSLRLEEFLRRRARLQRVEEEARRRVVLGFFNTLYWSRKFRRHMEQKRSARMTGVPQLGIPDILVDDEDDRTSGAGAGHSTGAASLQTAATFLSADHAAGPAQHHRSWSGASIDISLHDTNYAHPLSAPRTGGLSSPTSSGGLQPQRHHYNSSAFSFELQEPSAQFEADGSRRGSAVSAMSGASGMSGVSGVSPGLVREMLDDSVWVESIRRSATQRRSGWGT